MKVALLVFPLHHSHGCILQTYALYSKLRSMGCDVTILDRQPEDASLIRLVFLISKRVGLRLLKGYRGAIFYKGWFPKKIMGQQQSFIDSFRKDIIEVHSTEELESTVSSGNFDTIVVGSDQTWRPCNVPNVMDYWLDFARDISVRKVAYAPSFGVDNWEYTEEQTVKCKELAGLFTGLSVREESGVRLCKDNIGFDVTHVLDPTMLWDISFYAPIAKRFAMNKGGCQCYFLDRSPEKLTIANQVADLLHLEVNFINTETENENAPFKKRIAPSIEKWLAGFYNGDFIVVDSFHAMVFSIIFQKSFIVLGNRKRGLSRFESLLKELGLENRLLSDLKQLTDIINEPIDWESVNEKLKVRRQFSIGYLKENLGLQ